MLWEERLPAVRGAAGADVGSGGDGLTVIVPGARADDHRRGANAAMFARLRRNVSWLLGARGASGVLSVAYLAVASRALGATGFGAFALILAYAGSIAGLAQFKSWQAVVRYGAMHLAEDRRDRLERLIGFTAAIDLASALAGAALALVGTLLAAPLFGWTDAQASMAALFGAAILLTTGDTASGMLRLSGRFALLSGTETLASLVRLVGAVAVWAGEGGLGTMLAVWGLAAAAESGFEWILVLAMRDLRIRFGWRHWRRALAENPRIGRFMIDSSLASSLGMVWQQAGTLSVGAAAGPAAAGAFRVAAKLATAITKPAETTMRALYPELAALVASRDPRLLRRVATRTTAIGASLALMLVAAIWIAGPGLLRLVSGRTFVTAQPYLLLLTVATAVDLCAIVLDPLLSAHGMSRAIVVGRIIGGAAYVVMLATFLPLFGPSGAAMAAIVGSVTFQLWLALAARRLFAAPQPQDAEE